MTDQNLTQKAASWDIISEYRKKFWSTHPIHVKVTNKLFDEGCYVAPVHLVNFVETLIARIDELEGKDNEYS